MSRDSIVDGCLRLTDVSVTCRAVNPRPTSQKIGGYCTECTGQGNEFELIPTVKKESFGNEFPSIYNHCGVMAAWSRKMLKKNHFFCVFFKNDPFQENCQNSVPKVSIAILFRKFSLRHQSTCCGQISWNLADWKSVVMHYLPDKKKQNFAWLSTLQLSLLHGPHPESARASPQQCAQECSRFHPNRFTFGGVTSEHVNTIIARLKVNPIFGWSLASGQIITSK